MLGAQVYRGVEFCGVEEPDDNHESSGWRISVNPPKHPVNLLNVDVLIGAEGKRVSVPGKILSSSFFFKCTFLEFSFRRCNFLRSQLERKNLAFHFLAFS